MPMRVLPLLFALATVALPARVRAEDDPACAQFQEPLAYNECLARHGPKAAAIAGAPASAQAGHSLPATGPLQPQIAAPKRSGFWRHAARARGRAHMEFRVR